VLYGSDYECSCMRRNHDVCSYGQTFSRCNCLQSVRTRYKCIYQRGVRVHPVQDTVLSGRTRSGSHCQDAPGAQLMILMWGSEGVDPLLTVYIMGAWCIRHTGCTMRKLYLSLMLFLCLCTLPPCTKDLLALWESRGGQPELERLVVEPRFKALSRKSLTVDHGWPKFWLTVDRF